MGMKIKQIGASAVFDATDGVSGDIPLADNDPQRQTYTFFTGNFVPGVTPTDILQIQGSATKIVKLRSIVLTGTATAASVIVPTLVRRSTANSGGTSAGGTFAKRDNNDLAPTAVLTTWSANPTALGTLVATLDGSRLSIAPASNGGIDRMLFQYTWLNEKAPTLRGLNDFFCLNLGGIAWPAGGALDMQIYMTEE
jgi:hypothetical protein